MQSDEPPSDTKPGSRAPSAEPLLHIAVPLHSPAAATVENPTPSSAPIRSSHATLPRHAHPPLRSLTGVRALCAFYIFVYHYGEFGCSDLYIPLTINGRVAVSMFFCLSGFLLFYNYHHCEMATRSCMLAFWLKRYFRLMPAYWLLLLLNVNDIRCMWGDDASGSGFCSGWKWWDSFLHLFGVNVWLPIQTQDWNGPSWSISTELGYYLLFPFLLRLYRLMNAKWGPHAQRIMCAAIMIYSILPTLILGLISSTFDPVSWRVYVWPITRLGEFTAGMMCASIFIKHFVNTTGRSEWPTPSSRSAEMHPMKESDRNLSTPQFPSPSSFSSFASNDSRCSAPARSHHSFLLSRPWLADLYFVLLLLFLSIPSFTGAAGAIMTDWCAFGLLALPLCALLFLLAIAEVRSTGTQTRPSSSALRLFLASPLLVWCGDISYSFYLIHRGWPALALWIGYQLPPSVIAQVGGAPSLPSPSSSSSLSPFLATPYLLMTLGVAAPVHRFVEQPAYRAGLQWLTMKQCVCHCLEDR